MFSKSRFSLKIARNLRLGERVCSLEDAMRMVKMKPKSMDLETAMQKFLLVKESQHTGEETMKDYRNCLARFLADSHNSLDYPLLESDVLTFFAAIPDTSPARYNKPFQNINAFLNWALEQELRRIPSRFISSISGGTMETSSLFPWTSCKPFLLHWTSLPIPVSGIM